jgi:hypothetical protein
MLPRGEDPAQAGLIVVTRMNKAFSLFALLFFVSLVFTQTSFAEVCDKIAGESWRPQDGPRSLITPLSNLFWLPFVFAGILFCIIRWRLGKTATVFGWTLLLASLGVLVDQPQNDSFYELAYREGCYSVNADRVSALTLLCLSVVVFAVRRRLRNMLAAETTR